MRDEVPHSVAVLVNEFAERDDLTYISAVIYVERDTQKMILLGKDGQMLKRIGQAARQQIEELLEARVYLDLWVKVRPKWRTIRGVAPPGLSDAETSRRKEAIVAEGARRPISVRDGVSRSGTGR